MIKYIFSLVLFVSFGSNVFATNINFTNFAIGITNSQGHPDNGILWSTLGVLADSNGISGNGTDNTNALNALPTSTVIIGDCAAGGNVRIAGQWQLQSNLTIYMKAGCSVYCDWISTQTGVGCISQNDVLIPLTNVFISDLYFKLINPNFKGKALRFYIDTLSLIRLTVDGFYAMAFVRGSDQEWSYPKFINTLGSAGNDATGTATAGLRFFGNSPKVPTTGGKHANVWVHDGFIALTGDGAIQVAPACQLPPAVWVNLDADDYLFENTYASGSAGNGILVANGAQDSVGLSCTNTMSNLVFRNITGASASSAIRIQNGFDTGAITGMTLQNITYDMSPKSSATAQAAILIRGYDSSPIYNITMNNIVLQNNYGVCVDYSAYPSSGINIDNINCSQPRAGAQANIVVRAASNFTIKNSTLVTRSGGGIQLGATSGTGGALLRRVNGGLYGTSNANIQNNSITEITNNDAGIWLLGSNTALISGNTVNKKSNATSDIGINLATTSSVNDPGAVNNTVINNILNSNIPLICAPSSQGNIVNSNTGASSCP